MITNKEEIIKYIGLEKLREIANSKEQDEFYDMASYSFFSALDVKSRNSDVPYFLTYRHGSYEEQRERLQGYHDNLIKDLLLDPKKSGIVLGINDTIEYLKNKHGS